VNHISLETVFNKAERRTAGEIFTISFTPILFLSVVFAPSRPFFFLIFFPTFNGGGGDAVSRRAFYNFVSPTNCMEEDHLHHQTQKILPLFLMVVTI
jgi:hypothetical protein